MEKIVYKTYVKTINQFLKSSDKDRGIDFVLYDKELTLCRGMDTWNYRNQFYTQHNSYCVIDKNYELLDWRDDYTKIVCEELGQNCIGMRTIKLKILGTVIITLRKVYSILDIGY